MAAKIEIDVIVNTPEAAAKLKSVQTEIAKTAVAANKLDSTIGTSISNGANKAGQSIFNLTEKLRGLQSSVFTEKDRGKIAAYNKEIVKTQKEITTLSTVGTSSFGNLGAGAGKAFSALRTVANILPGVGIAGLLAFAVGPVIEYVASLFDASDASKKLAEDQNELKKVTEGIFNNVAKEATGVISLIAILKDENETRIRKNQALKDLQKINPEIFNALKLEEGAVIGLDGAYVKYIESLKTVIAAKIKQAQIENLVEKLLKAQGTTLVGNERALFNFTKQRNAEEKKRLSGLQDAGARGTASALDEFEKKGINNIKGIENEIKILSDELTQLSKGISLNIDTDNTDKTKKDTETIASTLEKLRLKLAEINQEQALLGINADDYKKKISAVLSTATTLVTKFKVDPKSTLISKLLIGDGSSSLSGIESVATTRIKESIRRIRIGLKNELIAAPIDIPIGTSESNFKDYTDAVKAGLILRLKALKIPFNPLDNAEGLQKQLDDAQARLEKFRQDVTDILQNTFQNAAVAVGEVIGKALGGGGISSLFDGLFTAIGNGLKSLGTYLIKTYLLIELLEKIKFNNPVAGVAVGVALVALGSLITARINKSAAFADGGYVSGRGGPRSDSIPAMLSNGEFVIKAATVSKLGLGFLNQLNNGGAVGTVAGIEAGLGVVQQVYVTGRIQGKDILLSSDRAQASKNRNT